MIKKVHFYFIFLLIIFIIMFIFLFKIFNHNIKSYAVEDSYSDAQPVKDSLPPTTDTSLPISLEDIYTPEAVTPLHLLDNGFELPLNGSSGYCSINLSLLSNPDYNSSKVSFLTAGTGFKILKENNDWWYVSINNCNGWLPNKYCMINLPDVIPSIIYDDTNSYKSLFLSSQKELPNITGKQLYNVYQFNSRLNKEEFIMPIMYPTAKKIAKVQHLALSNNQSLKIYETFRPLDVQKKISSNLSFLMNNDSTVFNGINRNSWNESWFIAQSISNHQRGIALDVSLVNVIDSTYNQIGKYSYTSIIEYKECKMPTRMHELSADAVSLKYGVNSNSKTAWQNVPLSNTMTESAICLQNYFTKCGFCPLASEWWHFNDLDTKDLLDGFYSSGQYYIRECLSSIPE